MIVPKELEEKRKELKAQQWKKFKVLLKKVLTTNEFYRRKYAKVGVKSADDIKTWDDFKKLPFTTREELIADQKKHPPYGTNLTLSLNQYSHIKYTSGSSSKRQLYLPLSKEDEEREIGEHCWCYQQIGVVPGDIVLYTQRTPYDFFLINKETGIVFIKTVGLSIQDQLKILIELPITIFNGSPTLILRLIELAKDKKINLKEEIHLRKFLVGSECFPNSLRAVFEKTFSADCYTIYGSTEMSFMAFECPYKSDPHLTEEFVITEVIADGKKNESNEGEVVGTSLTRHDFPFIRYRTGDFIELDWGLCSCGSISPRIRGGVVKRISSRFKFNEQFVFADDIENIVKTHVGIREYFIELVRRKGLDEMVIQIEMPLSEEKIIVPKLASEVYRYFSTYPKVISVAYGTLRRMSGKSKRFKDSRFEASNKLMLPPESFLSNLPRRLLRKIIYSALGGYHS